MKRPRTPWAWVPTLYFAEGLPYVVVMVVSVVMYKKLGIGNTEIALYTSWLYLPWVIKPLWSPVVDMFGTKRRWVIGMQSLMGIAFAMLAFTLPGDYYFQLSMAVFWVLAFLSATHDVAADGFYMLGLDQKQQSFFVGIRSTFYRVAMVSGQGLLVVVAGIVEGYCGSVTSAWIFVFVVLSVLFLVLGLWHSFALPRAVTDAPVRNCGGFNELRKKFIATFISFFRKPGILGAIFFMLCYRLPEAQLLKLISPFLLDSPEVGGLGLSTTQVGFAYGTTGMVGLTVGGIVGGMVASGGGLRRWLLPMAWSMSLSCGTFVFLAYADSCLVNFTVVNVCVFIEQFGYGFGATAYTLYLIYFSEGTNSTSHYAMCTGIMALGMMLPGMFAGWIEELVGYRIFFIWTMVCCLFTIGSCYVVNVPRDFGRKQEKNS